MTDTPDDILDGLFHGCAFAAYIEQAQAEQGWPDSDATRQRAYRHYEHAVAEKNAARSAQRLDPHGGDDD